MNVEIHKLNITPEAAFDLRECLGLDSVDRYSLKAEVEKYIEYLAASGNTPYYFRCDYVDENSGRRLKFFVSRSNKLGRFQYWDLRGVCESADWSEDAEDEGIVRMWLNVKIDELPEEDDWVVAYRVNKIIFETELEMIEDVLEEVRDAFEHKRDQELAKKLLLLQSTYFGVRGRSRNKTKAFCD
jgi:hypothetical protein